jgi:hypothetical protein
VTLLFISSSDSLFASKYDEPSVVTISVVNRGPASEMNALRYAADLKNGDAEAKRYKAMIENDPFFRGVEEGTIS